MSRRKKVEDLPMPDQQTDIEEQIKEIKQSAGLIHSIQTDDDKYVRDMYELVKNCSNIGNPAADVLCALTTRIREKLVRMPTSKANHDLYWECVRREARYKFESFMLYMEKNRKPSERFYQPRINPLRQVAQGVQDLADDKLDELFVNLPPRTGKTQIIKFATVWWGSRNPELSCLYTAYSDKITQPFYVGLNELITDPTYTYKEIFPEITIARTKGDDEIIDLNRAKTYPTFTCRSLYGTLNGSCDCTGLGVSDDLLSGIEEALSADRLETAWGKYDNNFMSRIKFDQGAKLINMGTRWAILDPQGRRQTLITENERFRNWRYRVISIPALDERDESNFDYAFGVGFSSETYLRRRASFEANSDEASWYAQYQQEPIDRQGALFASTNMKFYNGDLPVDKDNVLKKPDRIFMACDIAFGGGDYVSAPVAFQYGSTCYVHDVVYNNGDKFVTRPLVVDAIIRNGVQASQFEATKTTMDYPDWISEELRKLGVKCTITTKAAPNGVSKLMRIFDKAPEIREFYFRDANCRNKEYQKFMECLFSFKMAGRNQHDDAPDSMAQLCDMLIVPQQFATIIASPY